MTRNQGFFIKKIFAEIDSPRLQNLILEKSPFKMENQSLKILPNLLLLESKKT